MRSIFWRWRREREREEREKSKRERERERVYSAVFAFCCECTSTLLWFVHYVLFLMWAQLINECEVVSALRGVLFLVFLLHVDLHEAYVRQK